MNDCDRANELVRAWEEGRAIGSGDLAFFREHCASCPSCRKHFSALLPFISRDVDGAPINALDDGPPGLPDAVMARLKGRVPAGGSRRVSWVMAAAAAGIVVLLGIGLLAL